MTLPRLVPRKGTGMEARLTLRRSDMQRSFGRLIFPLAVAATLVACAGKPQSSGLGPQSKASQSLAALQSSTGPSAREQLAQLAAIQVATPDQRAIAVWRKLPALDVASMETPTTDDQAAARSLASLVAAIPATEASPVERDVAPDDLIESQKLYIRGKSQLLAGEVGQALQSLETALRLDPSSIELLSQVGEVQLRAGRRLQGIASLRKAAMSGPVGARSAWLLGREEMRQGDADAALRVLLPAHRDVDVARSPVLAAGIDAELARALLAKGNLSAANEALGRSLTAPIEQFAASIDARDFGEVIRDRPTLTMLRGDIASRIGAYSDAIEAYTQASSMAGVDPATPFTKLLAAHLQQGHSAEAAIVLLRHIDARQGVVDESLERAAALLARDTDVGSLLIASLMQSQDGERSASIQHRLARLAAGAAPTPIVAREALESAISKAGPDVTSIATLLDTFETGEVEAKAAALARVVTQHPMGCDAAAEALLESGRDTASMIAVASQRLDLPSRLLATSTLRRLGRSADAIAALGDVSDAASPLAQRLALCVARAANASASGEPAKATEIAASITALAASDADSNSADVARARALCLIQAGKILEARAALAPLVDGTPQTSSDASATVDDYLLAADLAIRDNAVAQVAPLLQRARAFDATDERVHEAFAALYSPAGPSPNEQLLGEAMRELRGSIPGSQLLRLIIAQDQVQRGIWRQAMPNLQALVNDRGRPADALDSLVRLWERNADEATRVQAEAFLRERFASRPQSTRWTLALSRMLVRNGKAQEADELLAKSVEALRSDLLLRQREFVLREGLNQPERADALLQERLALAPPTLANRLELASIAVRQGKPLDGLRSLSEAAPLAPTMVAAQARTLVGIVSATKPEELRELSQPQSESLVQLLDAARRLNRFAPAGELTRVQLLAQARPAASAELFDACKQLAPASEQIATLAMLRIAESLRTRADHSPLIRFVGTIVIQSPEANPVLMNEWVVRTAVRGSIDDVRFLVDNIRDVDMARNLLGQYSDDEVPDELTLAKAQAAYVVSNLATTFARDSFTKATLEYCLSIHPKHAWAANNLGYLMLNQGGDVNRIVELVEIAYEQLSDSASVTDTLGWLRYKQGILDDQTLPDGTKREGAISIIERAVDMLTATGDSNAELFDHLGDALWQRNRAAQADGTQADRERAVDLWRRAVLVFDDELAMRRNLDLPGMPRVAEIEAHRATIDAKRNAAETTGNPTISPMSVPAVFTPRPEGPPVDVDAIWSQGRQRELQQ